MSKRLELRDLPSYTDDRGILTPVWNDWSRGDDDQYEGLRVSGANAKTCAGIDLDDVKRVYFINNSQKGVVRGFHFHNHETKYFVVLRGMAKFVAVRATGTEQIGDEPEKHTFDENNVDAFVLTERKPQMLIIPPGYANGWVSLTDDCLLLSLSSSTFDQSKGDDFRYPPDLFGDVWSVEPR